MSLTAPQPSSDDAPCKSCRQMVCSTTMAMNCNWCHAWFHIECVEIDEDTYHILENMKGSIWLCECCEEAFGQIKLRVDKLAEENVELKARMRKELEALGDRVGELAEENAELKGMMKELEELPCVVQSLRSQVESLSKDLELLLNGTDNSNTKNTKVCELNPAAPPLKLTNRFQILAQYDQPTITPITESDTPLPSTYQTYPVVTGMTAKTDTPSPKGDTSYPRAANKAYPTASPRPKTSPPPVASKIYPSLERMDAAVSGPRQNQTNSHIPSAPGKFFIRGVPMSTALETIQNKLISYGIPHDQVNTLTLPVSLISSAMRKYLEITLTTPMANKLHEALKTERSLGWFVSMLPPRPPKRGTPNQPLYRVQHPSQAAPHQTPPPSDRNTQFFRTNPIPPLMSLNLGPGMSGDGDQTPHNG